MDIWAWVYETQGELRRRGEHRLAALADHVLYAISANDHRRVDALLPEALAMSRADNNPWLEIYFRHWGLQSRVMHRVEGAPALSEAVSLVEFGHRPGHDRCPQSVCAVQDLCACYGNCDGPGYAAERIQVARETMARIDPRWPCYRCIGDEQSHALLDAGRLDEAERVLSEQQAALRKAGQEAADDFEVPRIQLAFRRGRPEEALRLLDNIKKRGGREDGDLPNVRLRRAIYKAGALARLGRHEQASRLLPDLDDVEGTPEYYGPWAETAALLAEAGALPNDGDSGGVLRQFVRELARRGAFWRAFQVAITSLRLTLHRRRPAAAALDLGLCRAMAAQLREPGRVSEQLEALAVEVAGGRGPKASAAKSPESLLDRLAREEDDELVLERLQAARRRWPEHAALVRAWGACLIRLGFDDEATEGLREHVAAHPTDSSSAMLLGDAYLRRGDHAALETLAGSLRAAGAPAQAHALCARLEDQRGRDAACLAHLRAVVEAEPDWLAPRRLYVAVARRTGDFATMLEQVEALLARAPDRSLHWDRMVAATALGDWARVRDSAAAAGLKVGKGGGPIARDQGLVRLRFRSPGQEPYHRYAIRTGPVTARIDEAVPPPAPEHYGDQVVFEPVPLEGGAADDDERIPTFDVVASISSGGYRTFELRGFYPGPNPWQKIEKAVTALGCVIQRRTDTRYALPDPKTGRPRVAILASLAVPAAVTAPQVHAVLVKAAGRLPRPLAWAACARAAGDDPRASAHEELITAWDT